MSKNKLFLIDGHALIFRMYYAFIRQPMINSMGEDTSILYGVSKYILEILKKEEPSHIAIAFDPPCKTFRHDIFPEYKANRSATPELVKSSLEPLIEIMKSIGIQVVMMEGYEADDVIGTLATTISKKEYQVFIVSPDKDLGQVVSNNIFQIKANTKGKNEILGETEVCEKFGIKRPSQIIDLLSIWGDSVDNIKGVRGIGEIGAKKLLAKYDSIDNIIDHLDDLTPSQRKSFEEAIPNLDLTKTLVTIKTDVPLTIQEDDLRYQGGDNKKTAELFKKYEFPSLLNILPKGEIPLEKKKIEYELVSLEEIYRLANEKKEIGIKIEGEYIYISSSNSIYKSSYFHDLKELIENPSIKKIGYSLKEYIKILRKKEIEINGDIADIELIHYLENPERSHKIDILANRYLNIHLDDIEDEVEVDLFSEANTSDEDNRQEKKILSEISVITPIYHKLINSINSSILDLYNTMEMPLLRVLADIEYQGFKINSQMLRKYSSKLSIQAAEIEKRIRETAQEPTLNIASPKQLGIVLYEKLKLDPKVKKNSKNSYPTDEETLDKLRDKSPIINDILEFRSLTKLISTYIDPFPLLIDKNTGKVHTTFNQATTSTGRLSSTKPNLQNIPIRTELGKYIREAFIPSNDDGYILSADYSQIELRVMAVMSNESDLIKAFNEGKDIHRSTAARIFGIEEENVDSDQRRIAKTANFGIIYGISSFGLSQRLKIPIKDAKQIIEEYFKNYPEIHTFLENIKSFARENGYVETLFKRRRYITNINSGSQLTKNLAERTAINAPIQGTAADIIKLAMINIHSRMNKEGLSSKMILQVHDELVFDVVSSEKDIMTKIIKEEMENVIPFSVPLSAECGIGKNWLQAH